MLILLLLIALAIGLFWLILQADVPGIWKFAIVVLEMILVSQILVKRYKLDSELGMVLFKSEKGLRIIDQMARKQEALWIALSEVGSAISYGILGYYITRKKMNPLLFIGGIVLMYVLAFLVAPTVFLFLFKILNLGAIDKAAEAGAAGGSIPGIEAVVVFGLLAGGMFLFILAGIVYYGIVVLSAVVSTVAFGTAALASTSPGGTFLLPGINLPLFEGIGALVVVMLVHETAHAVLARIAKVPVVSSGLVFFGILPVGAFIEPDEKKLAKAEDLKQTRVLVAGPSANFITSVVSFVLFLGWAFIMREFALSEGILGGAAMFVYYLLGLIFSLNFIVGMVNLLPLPVFDGGRVMEVNIKNVSVVNALKYGTLFFFLMNFLPWLFR